MDFIQTLKNQLHKNLGDFLTALNLDAVDWPQMLGFIGAQTIIAGIYLGLFFCGYWLLCKALQWLIGRKPQLLRYGRMGVAYLAALGAFLAIGAQFGVSAKLLSAFAKAGFMGLGFYVLWLVVGQLSRIALQRSRVDASIRQLINNILSVVFATFACITVLAQFGFDVVSIVAGLGIAGIAVGFAAQSTLANFIAGITLLIERPFRIGDWVTINGQAGKVTKIALRTTWLRTRDNIFTMIPNDSVASSEIINYSAQGATRLNIPVGIAYKSSVPKARDIMLQCASNHESVLKQASQAPRVLLTGLGDSSVNLLLQVWIGQHNLDSQPKIIADLLEAIKLDLETAGIEIPFPHLQLFIDEAKGLEPLAKTIKPSA